MFIKGTAVKYKDICGIVSFANKKIVTILIREGIHHRSQDIKIVVHFADFDQIEILDEK
jgi:hypothetical protein